MSSRALVVALMGSAFALQGGAFAQEEEPEVFTDTIVVEGSLRALPVEDVGSVFGFDKDLVETPRSASTISAEQIERFGITDIYGLVAQAPGTFTNSFFGIGGALDIRGTPGEVYFRGVRRLDNPGNYPTPIGASDRIDIVRGPASVIYGPSKTGGYMNFVPKTARVAGGELMTVPEGEITYTGGSWNKSVLSAALTGPGNILGEEFGYHLYAEVEDSGSYYRNMFTEQTILQGAFDKYMSDNLRVEFGFMYHDFYGQQNGGWNRLTQELVDNGTYVTGTAQAVDQNGDGELGRREFDAAGVFNPFGNFVCDPSDVASFGVGPEGMTDACLMNSLPGLALTDVGETTLDRRNVLTGEDDFLENKTLTFYFDSIYENDDGFELISQLFFEGYENENENDYGFSQFHDSWVMEGKLIVKKAFENDLGVFTTQISPSIRYTDFLHGDDFDYEFFHRADLSSPNPYTAQSDRLLSTEGDENYSTYVEGDYINYGLAGLFDLDFEMGLNVILGVRYDYIDAESFNHTARLDPAIIGSDYLPSASDEDDGVSWTASLSYDLPGGVVPYVTASEQSTVVAGQGAEITVDNLAAGTWFSASELLEFGIKGSFFDDRLYTALSVYEQERVDFNAQSITVNQSVKTEGLEAEFRWAATDNLLITGAYTKTEVVNLTGLEEGTLFSFFGAEDLVNVSDPSLFYGAQPIGLLTIPDEDAARRAGIPENIYSLTATYAFDNGLSLSGSVVDVEEVFSGQSQAVELPAYTLVDASASYEYENWLFQATVKNLTDEEYFRANFTELFGSTIVLPEMPRSFQASVVYKF
nr:TonB-dependent receptor plug domain-containing protein [Parvularcula bermudensis]